MGGADLQSAAPLRVGPRARVRAKRKSPDKAPARGCNEPAKARQSARATRIELRPASQRVPAASDYLAKASKSAGNPIASQLPAPEAHGFPTPLWTCPRIARLIADQFGVDYHAGHVWKILRTLHWSPQRPVGKARERNEEAIRTWKHKTWPGIKKKPKPKAARSSSSTKADELRSRIVAAPGRPAARHPCRDSTSTGTSFPCRRG